MKISEEDYREAEKILKPFSKKSPIKAGFQFAFTFTILWSIVICSFLFAGETPWVALITIPLTVVFMCRSYVLEHDSGHQNLFKKAYLNDLVGNIMGFGIMIPFSMWKFIHNSHHAHVGNLDKRSWNPEVWTMTVGEFNQASHLKRVFYRCMRSKFGRLVITPTLNFGIAGRLVHPKYSRNAIISVLVHNAIYLFTFWYVISLVGFMSMLLFYIIPLILFFGVAAFTLYGQHQFEETYWKHESDWSWKDASIHGSTNLQAPAWFRWVVGNVLHHNTHHINSNIPNYKLHEAQLALAKKHDYNNIPVREVWRWLSLALWDEDQQKLVSIKYARKKTA